MKKTLSILGMCTLILLGTACNSDNDSTNDKDPQTEQPKIRWDIQLTDTEKEMAMQSADFSIRLLQVANENIDNNSQIILSPLSVSFGLSMVTNGAIGDTQDELLETLGFDGFTTEEINAFHKKLIAELMNLDNTTSINIANSLWLNNGFIAKMVSNEH